MYVTPTVWCKKDKEKNEERFHTQKLILRKSKIYTINDCKARPRIVSEIPNLQIKHRAMVLTL